MQYDKHYVLQENLVLLISKWKKRQHKAYIAPILQKVVILVP